MAEPQTTPIPKRARPSRSAQERRHPVTEAPRQWTETELRAIALGRAAFDIFGISRGYKAGKEETAQREGFARGWAGLTGAARVEILDLRSFRKAWLEGRRKGLDICTSAAKGFSWATLEGGGGLHAVREGRAVWSQAQADAYDEGYQAGRLGLPDSKVPLRYRGPLRCYAEIWSWGRFDGLHGLAPDGSGQPPQARELTPALADGRKPAAAGSPFQKSREFRHRVTKSDQPGAPDVWKPVSGVERQAPLSPAAYADRGNRKGRCSHADRGSRN
jgi:hypothetical protein